MTRKEDRELGSVMELAAKGAYTRIKKRFADATLTGNDAHDSLRAGFANSGLDCDNTPPNCETIFRKVLTDGAIPRGTLAWDFYMLLFAHSGACWSLVDSSEISDNLEFRMGKESEVVTCMDKEKPCAGHPVLADQNRVLASPWSVKPDVDFDISKDPLFVCYMPQDLAKKTNPKAHLGRVSWMTWAYTFVYERRFSFLEPSPPAPLPNVGEGS
jgi:hypothetical protein